MHCFEETQPSNSVLCHEPPYQIVNDVKKAEVIVVNTCGFIESAKQEAIDTILEMAKYKKIGICKYLIVMGCLVERYQKELKKALPEVDLFIPINKIEDGKFTKSTNENIMKFRDYLNDHGIVATIRRELGSDINAACGQLRRQNLNKSNS